MIINYYLLLPDEPPDDPEEPVDPDDTLPEDDLLLPEEELPILDLPDENPLTMFLMIEGTE